LPVGIGFKSNIKVKELALMRRIYITADTL